MNARFNLHFLFLMWVSAVAASSSPASSLPSAEAPMPPRLLAPVSITLIEAPLLTAITMLAEKGGIAVNYNEDMLRRGGPVSIWAADIPAIDAFMTVLAGTGIGLNVTGSGEIVLIPPESARGSVRGTIADAATGAGLAGANAAVAGALLGAAADSDGKFSITRLPAGVYTLEFSMIGFRTERIEHVVVVQGKETALSVRMKEKPISVGEVIVTPGHFSLMDDAPSSSDGLRAEDIRSFPQLGEDVYRAITRLPGVGGNDFSAKFTVRGGEHEEVLVLLDGMELYEPFHLKLLDSFLSIVDVEAIREIDMMTGAFPAEYGNKLSGVFNMQSTAPAGGEAKTSLAVSFLNARLRSEGNFGGGDGQWLFVARRGYLDLLLSRVGVDEIRPTYYDAFGKMRYFLTPRHAVGVHLLAAYDDLRTDFIEEVDLAATHGNAYGWVTWDAGFTERLSAQTVVSTGRLDQSAYLRKSPDEDADLMGDIDDDRAFSFHGVKQNWEYEYSGDYLLKWGIDYKRLREDFDLYFRKELFTANEWAWTHNEASYDTIDVGGGHEGHEFGLYIANRFRPAGPLTAETGLRYDRASWTGDRVLSPRVNLAWSIGESTVFRAGWGRFHQTQAIDGHNIQDGEERYYPAERAEHYVLGVEHEFGNGIRYRVEAYRKKLSSLRPRWYNFNGSSMNAFGYAHEDRIRLLPESGESKGIEVYVKRDEGGALNWWCSYALAVVEDRIGGLLVPRALDQRHTVYVDLNYRPGRKWCFNLAWNYHSGWPYTEPRSEISNWIGEDENGVYYDIRWAPGPLNARRLPAYHRLDLRASRFFESSHGRFTAFLELRNAYNRANVREYNFYHAGLVNGKTVVKQSTGDDWLPMLPSFGVMWEF